MNDAQTWTVIGGFLGMVTVMMTLLLRAVRSEVGSVRSEVGSLRTEMRTEFAGVRTQIAGLDRDVHMLVERAIDRE